MKRYTAQGESMPIKDIVSFYYNILSTAKDLNYEMPNYQELEYLLKSSIDGPSVNLPQDSH
jgi:hypothetical protein